MVPVSEQMPSAAAVIDQALQAEVAKQGLAIVADSGPVDVSTEGGLKGARRELTIRMPNGERQRRAYVMYKDATWLYGIHYLADEGTWDTFLPTYDAAAATVGQTPTG